MRIPVSPTLPTFTIHHRPSLRQKRPMLRASGNTDPGMKRAKMRDYLLGLIAAHMNAFNTRPNIVLIDYAAFENPDVRLLFEEATKLTIDGYLNWHTTMGAVRLFHDQWPNSFISFNVEDVFK